MSILHLVSLVAALLLLAYLVVALLWPERFQ
jgi:K+-transporting ATPase KdpF subunit